LFFTSASIGSASSTVSDHRPFVQQRDSLADVNSGVGNYFFLGISFEILLRQVDVGHFLMFVARRIVLRIIVSAATSSTMVVHIPNFPVTSTKLFNLFPSILVFVLLTMMINCFYGCVRAHSVDITAQIKNMEEPRLLRVWSSSSFLKKIQNCVTKEERV
jgi:hypothetical protein